MNYTDRSLTCVQCGTDFVFSADDQEFHASRGYQDPKRCPSCRAQRRAQNNSGGGGYSSSSYSTDGYSSGGYSERPRREMFTTTCSRCGREAQVPFVPRNDRPVYCSDCYQPAPRRW
jgi:CxxC-x17-CxxC domain-containing protein